MFRFSYPALALLLATAVALSRCGDDDGAPAAPDGPTVIEVLEGDDRFARLSTLLEAAGLSETLGTVTPLRYTVFAPNDAALAGVDAAAMNTGDLQRVLLRHVAVREQTIGTTSAADVVLAAGQQARFEVFSVPDTPFVDGDLLTLFLDARDGAAVNGVDIVDAGTAASNGLVYEVDAVLPATDLDLILRETRTLGLLSGALARVPALDSALGTGGPYTFFAPGDTAFAGVDLSVYSPQQLEEIFGAHVVEGYLTSDEFVRVDTLTTLTGARLVVGPNELGGVSVKDETDATYVLLDRDLLGTDGVVHVVDGVLLPGEL